MPSFCVPKNSSFIATFVENHLLRATSNFRYYNKGGRKPSFFVVLSFSHL